jgi:hypothetical protein
MLRKKGPRFFPAGIAGPMKQTVVGCEEGRPWKAREVSQTVGVDGAMPFASPSSIRSHVRLLHRKKMLLPGRVSSSHTPRLASDTPNVEPCISGVSVRWNCSIGAGNGCSRG